jgi:hypothetical protein
LNKDLFKNFAGARLTGNFSLKRLQWRNPGHALSSEMHEFAVDWIGLLDELYAVFHLHPLTQ